jgi:hypothetical protein
MDLRTSENLIMGGPEGDHDAVCDINTNKGMRILVNSSNNNSNVDTQSLLCRAGYGGGVRLRTDATTWESMSDARIKKNIETLDVADICAKVCSIRPVKYNLTTDADTDPPRFGMVAQELVDIFPDVVSNPTDGMWGIRYTELIAPLVACVNQQQRMITDLQLAVRVLQDQLHR